MYPIQCSNRINTIIENSIFWHRETANLFNHKTSHCYGCTSPHHPTQVVQYIAASIYPGCNKNKYTLTPLLLSGEAEATAAVALQASSTTHAITKIYSTSYFFYHCIHKQHTECWDKKLLLTLIPTAFHLNYARIPQTPPAPKINITLNERY